MKNLKDKVIINEIEYIIKNKNDLIQKVLLENRQWNNKILLLIGQFIKQFRLKHFLNIGCHIGTVSLPISKYIEKVTAIEAFPPTFEHLKENIKINKINNVDAFNCAVGNKSEKIYFFDSENTRIKDNSGGMHVLTEKDILNNVLSANIHSKKYSNEMCKLDDLNIKNFDIMLVDIEGKEYEMLIGGRDKIVKYKPILIIEIWNDQKRNLEKMSISNKEVVNYILKLGYRLLNQIGDNYIFFPNDKKFNNN